MYLISWENLTYQEKKIKKSGYLFQTFVTNNQSCDIKINFIENEHLAYHNDEQQYKHLNRKICWFQGQLDVTET